MKSVHEIGNGIKSVLHEIYLCILVCVIMHLPKTRNIFQGETIAFQKSLLSHVS